MTGESRDDRRGWMVSRAKKVSEGESANEGDKNLEIEDLEREPEQSRMCTKWQWEKVINGGLVRGLKQVEIS